MRSDGSRQRGFFHGCGGWVTLTYSMLRDTKRARAHYKRTSNLDTVFWILDFA